VHLCRLQDFKLEVELDWAKYQLVLFNLLQNSVKYNTSKGHIVVILSCTMIDDISGQCSLETTVVDTGIGISEDRHQLLFKPFSELKHTQNLEKVTNQTIGLGLACSHDIVKKLGGDIKLA